MKPKCSLAPHLAKYSELINPTPRPADGAYLFSVQSPMRLGRAQRRMKMACGHRYRHRYRGRDRNRLWHTSKTDCDCDCDPDTDTDGFCFLPLFSEQFMHQLIWVLKMRGDYRRFEDIGAERPA